MRRSWLLPEIPDALGMLGRQAAVTVQGMAALVAWAGGEPEAGPTGPGLRAPGR